jgi:hypothetical protein|tara:strand:+ start:747 stop:860 length:114 start_codon:yes stop_codon:yes gene_type:complete
MEQDNSLHGQQVPSLAFSHRNGGNYQSKELHALVDLL